MLALPVYLKPTSWSHRWGGSWAVALLCLQLACTGNTVGPSTQGMGNGNPSDACTGTYVAKGCTRFPASRLRRLTNKEYDASVAKLLGTTLQLGATLPSESRQSGFTRNEGQVVDSVYALASEGAAEALALEAVSNRLATLLPCAASGTPGSDCAATFVARFASEAYRRPATQEEKDGLLQLFQMGANTDGFGVGIQWVIRAVLQSASFLYVTELGNGAEAEPGTLVLSSFETAAQLSFLLTGEPPDAALQAAAADGSLLTGEVRAAQARRLLQSAKARPQLQNWVLEWLGIDRLRVLAKDVERYPAFAELKPDMLQESRDFVSHVLFESGQGLAGLLEGEQSFASSALAEAYGSSLPRRGILHQAAFLSATSNVADSGPIHRGVKVLRKVLCQPIADPSTLNIQVVPPPPSDSLTTRERFAQHSTNPDCAACHRSIDAIGFTFENFDAMGMYREQEQGKTVDASGALLGGDRAGTVMNSQELVARMAQSDEVKRCFALHLFRFASARTDALDETSFLSFWSQIPAAKQGDPLETLVAYAGSDAFIRRSAR